LAVCLLKFLHPVRNAAQPIGLLTGEQIPERFAVIPNIIPEIGKRGMSLKLVCLYPSFSNLIDCAAARRNLSLPGCGLIGSIR